MLMCWVCTNNHSRLLYLHGSGDGLNPELIVHTLNTNSKIYVEDYLRIIFKRFNHLRTKQGKCTT